MGKLSDKFYYKRLANGAGIIMTCMKDAKMCMFFHCKPKTTVVLPYTLKIAECTGGLWEVLYFVKAAHLFFMPNFCKINRLECMGWLRKVMSPASRIMSHESFLMGLPNRPRFGIHSRIKKWSARFVVP